MKDAQKPAQISLNTLIGRLRDGAFVIPDFQRDFEWQPWDIRDLMRSIFLDYYIGSLLLWRSKTENFDALACEPIYGFSGTGSDPRHIVLDGQQRLTALYYTFVAPDALLPNRRNRYFYYIRIDRFMNEDYDTAFNYGWTQYMTNLMADRQLQFQNHIFPLSTIGAGGWSLPNWVQDYERFWDDKVQQAKASHDAPSAKKARHCARDARLFGRHLQELTEQYQVSYIELDQDLDLSKVCDIFTQVNSKGVRLDVFDLINAMLRPKGLQLKHMWREAAPRLDFADTDRMNVYVLQVMSILRQQYCSPKYLYYLLPGHPKKIRESDGSLRKEVLLQSTDDFKELWMTSVQAIERALLLLCNPHEYGAVLSRYLPYVSIIPAFAALQTTASQLKPFAQQDAKRKIRYWYWASVFTNRYSGSVESTAARDYAEVCQWFTEDEKQPTAISAFKSRFRELDFRREVKRGTSIYNGVFNLLIVNGAKDWITGEVPLYSDLDDHHIVPKSWGKKKGLGKDIDSILNRSPLAATTDREVIGNRLPNQYLPELVANSDEETVLSVFSSHFITPEALNILQREPFTTSDYKAFLLARQHTIYDAIERLLIKERLDLTPQLREIDHRLEETELHLRQLVVQQLNNSLSSIPHHVQARVRGRLDSVRRRTTSYDGSRYSLLEGALEFADLRDLEDIIKNKSCWQRFATIFRSKPVLAERFTQMAELRNAIRHSRAVDEVTRLQGEAALIWFGAVMTTGGSTAP